MMNDLWKEERLTIKHTENLEERIERAKRLLQEVDRKNRKEE
jgi:hypothetical protein